jgi:hypothetical protein
VRIRLRKRESLKDLGLRLRLRLIEIIRLSPDPEFFLH